MFAIAIVYSLQQWSNILQDFISSAWFQFINAFIFNQEEDIVMNNIKICYHQKDDFIWGVTSKKLQI